MSCMWLVHTCVLTTPLFSHFTNYPGNNSTQNPWRAPEKVESSLPQEKPGGQIQAGQHANSATSSNTQWICNTCSTTDTTQWAICKTVDDQAARPHYQRNTEIFLVLRFCNPYISLL